MSLNIVRATDYAELAAPLKMQTASELPRPSREPINRYPVKVIAIIETTRRKSSYFKEGYTLPGKPSTSSAVASAESRFLLSRLARASE